MKHCKTVLLISLTLGLVWLRSSYGKLIGGVFVDNMGKTLTSFASKNPYSFYKDFLNNFAIPNSVTFGMLSMYGELLNGLAICVASLYLLFGGKNKFAQTLLIIGLIGGTFLNINFYFASGWTSASTETLNLLMAVIQIILVVSLIKQQTK